jgi:hypothetical protein
MVVDDALDFVLPRFSRHAWTSEEARDEWEPRMGKIRAALQDLTLESVSQGMRACGLIRADHGELDAVLRRCADNGIAVTTIEREASPKNTASVTANYALEELVSGPLPVGTAIAVVSRSATIENMNALLDRGAAAPVAALLGYPDCCARFLRELVGQRRLDATWSVAQSSGQGATDPSNISICAEPETNVLWAPLGIMAVPHIPCSFGCAASRQVGLEITNLARAMGYEAEIAWMQEILCWPVQWSALHGIAETKTPVLKMVARTDATAGKHTLDWQGAGRPESAAPGLSFPHQPPRRLKISESRSFARGLANTDGSTSH